MSLVPPPKVQKLQTALHAKAKESPSYRFYRLYDKVYRRDILEFAYLRCRSNDGAPGVDGQTFEDIEAYGRERWLDELTTELRDANVSTEARAPCFHPERRWQATSAGDRDTHSTLPLHPNRLRDSSPSPIPIIPFGVSASRSFAFAEGTILT